MREILVTAILFGSSMAFAAEPNLHIRLTGSASFSNGTGVAVHEGVLFVDTTKFDGKSGMVRVQKGLTSVYLVLSSREAGCSPSGEFDKKAFLQHNVIPAPSLPDLSSDDDYVIVIEAVESFNTRKTSTSTLLQALTASPISKLTSMAPWVGSVAVPSAVVDSIHLHLARAEAMTAADKGKIFASRSRFFSNAGTVIAISPEHTALHHQTTRNREPFESAAVVLTRNGDSWLATLDIQSREMTLNGAVPVRICEPVNRIIDEYAGRP